MILFVLLILVGGYFFPNDNIHDWQWVAWFFQQPGQWKFQMFIAPSAAASLESLAVKRYYKR